MIEHRQIVERWSAGAALILVTLVRVQGSSYRQPGARLIVCKDGTYEGSVSAGCLEADLLRKAAWLTRHGAAVERYSTLFDEAAELPFGLGCGGVIDVLLEPVESEECQALLRALDATLSGREHMVATWLPNAESGLRRAIFTSGSESESGELLFASSSLPSEIVGRVQKSRSRNAGAVYEGMFVERLLPPQRLFIFGAGDDAKPLAAMADLLGWSVSIVDSRAQLARKRRFPETNARVAADPQAAVDQIGSRDAVVIMTHSFEQDGEYLAAVLPKNPRYLGLLGSRQRSSLLISAAASKLDLSVSECCERISAPVGLDLGGEGPEAIALAILAEAQARCTGRGDDSRKLSAEHVLQYLSDADPEAYVRTQCALNTA